MEIDLQFVIDILVLACTYSLLALGLTLVFGILKIVNLAHGEFFMLGGFGCFYLLSWFHLNIFLTLVFDIIIVGLFGVLVERTMFRRLRGQMLESLIFAIGLSVFLQVAALVAFGTEPQAIPTVFGGKVRLGTMIIPAERLAVIGISLCLVAAMYFFIKWTKIGQAMRAVADDSDAAILQGISPDKIFSLGFGFGCALAGVAGALLGSTFYVDSAMGTGAIMKAFTVVILGGLGSIPGAICGAFILATVEYVCSTFWGVPVATLAGFIVIIFVLLIRPTGLLGIE